MGEVIAPTKNVRRSAPRRDLEDLLTEIDHFRDLTANQDWVPEHLQSSLMHVRDFLTPDEVSVRNLRKLARKARDLTEVLDETFFEYQEISIVPPTHLSGAARSLDALLSMAGRLGDLPENRLQQHVEAIEWPDRALRSLRRMSESMTESMDRSGDLSPAKVVLHPTVVEAANGLFTSGHYRESVNNAFMALNAEVRRLSGSVAQDGTALMQHVFSIKTPLLIASENSDQQLGYMWLFSGAMMAVRNVTAHHDGLPGGMTKDDAINWLVYASTLFRVLDGCRRPLS